MADTEAGKMYVVRLAKTGKWLRGDIVSCGMMVIHAPRSLASVLPRPEACALALTWQTVTGDGEVAIEEVES